MADGLSLGRPALIEMTSHSLPCPVRRQLEAEKAANSLPAAILRDCVMRLLIPAIKAIQEVINVIGEQQALNHGDEGLLALSALPEQLHACPACGVPNSIMLHDCKGQRLWLLALEPGRHKA